MTKPVLQAVNAFRDHTAGHEKAIVYVRGNGVTSVMPFSVVRFFRGRQSAGAWKQGGGGSVRPTIGTGFER